MTWFRRLPTWGKVLVVFLLLYFGLPLVVGWAVGMESALSTMP